MFISQAIAGAGQYTGAAGAGLIQFTELINWPSLAYVPRIQFLSLTLQGAAAAVTVSVGLAATAAANRAQLINSTGTNFVISCPVTLGKAAFNDIHEVYVVTTGKTGAGLLEVVWFPVNGSA